MRKMFLGAFCVVICVTLRAGETSVVIKTPDSVQRKASGATLRAIIESLGYENNGNSVKVKPDKEEPDTVDKEYVVHGALAKSSSKKNLDSLLVLFANVVNLTVVSPGAQDREEKAGMDKLRVTAVRLAKALGDNQIAAKPGPYSFSEALAIYYSEDKQPREWRSIDLSVDLMDKGDEIVKKLNQAPEFNTEFEAKLLVNTISITAKNKKRLYFESGTKRFKNRGEVANSPNNAVATSSFTLETVMPEAKLTMYVFTKGDVIAKTAPIIIIIEVKETGAAAVAAEMNNNAGFREHFYARVESGTVIVRAIPTLGEFEKHVYFEGFPAERLGGDFAAAKDRATAVYIRALKENSLRPYFLTAFYDDVLEGIVLDGVTPGASDPVLSTAREFSSTAKFINHVVPSYPIVEINVDFISVIARKEHRIGANVLGANGSGVGVVTTSEFLISKSFLPNNNPATVNLEKSSSKFAANHQFIANTTNQTAQVVASTFLSTKSGSEATFRQGGEVGVTVLSTGVATVEYRPFGFWLKVIPTVQFDGRITCELVVEVSAPTQPSNKSFIQFAIANTKNLVDLREGQSLVLSGISSDMKDKLKSGIPFLRKVPVLNFLFSDKNEIREGNDLVIVLTPHIKYAPVDRTAYVCHSALASQNAVSRINDEKNIWSQRDGDKVERLRNTQNFLTNGEVTHILPHSVSRPNIVERPVLLPVPTANPTLRLPNLYGTMSTPSELYSNSNELLNQPVRTTPQAYELIDPRTNLIIREQSQQAQPSRLKDPDEYRERYSDRKGSIFERQ